MRKSGTARVIGTIGAVFVLISGVTFAALQSQNATSQGNRISSATASLSIGDSQGNFSGVSAGFNFANVEPGSAPATGSGNIIKLRNDGTAPLNLRLAINSASLANVNNSNLDRIYIDVTPTAGGAMRQYPISTLMSAQVANRPMPLGMTLPAGQTAQYMIQIEMTQDAIPTGNAPALLTNVDFVFSGTTEAIS